MMDRYERMEHWLAFEHAVRELSKAHGIVVQFEMANDWYVTRGTFELTDHVDNQYRE